MTANQILERNPSPTDTGIREGFHGKFAAARAIRTRERGSMFGRESRTERHTGHTMATASTKTETLVGKRIRRREDPRLITGTATYVDDIQMPGPQHACIVRSPHGTAKIRSIHLKPALEFPGLAAVFVGKDTEKVGPVSCGSSLPGLRVPHHHILAIDRVYCVGPPVAVVGASDRYIARDAAEAIEVDYDPPREVSDPEALASGPLAVHPEWPDNIAFNYHQDGGYIEKAFAEAEVIVKQRITSQRQIRFIKGEGLLNLNVQGDSTEVRSEGGQRLLDTTSKMIIKKFFEKLAEAAVE